MKNIFFVILFLNMCSTMHAQADSTFYAFPEDWVGTWKGTLEIFGADAVKMKVPMSLELHPIDSSDGTRYTWGLMYASKKKDWRPYELVLVNKTLGLWQIDEKNSIKIEGYQRGNAFVSWFVVQGNRVLCIYERTAEGLTFQVVSGTESPISVTGNGEQEGEKIPEVSTFPATTYQKALLTKEEK